MKQLLDLLEQIAAFNVEAARQEIRAASERLLALGWPAGSFRKSEMELIAVIESFQTQLRDLRAGKLAARPAGETE